MPRCSFIRVWNSFTSVHYAISDNAQTWELMNTPATVTRDEVNWRYWLPLALSLDLPAPNQLRVNWQGGSLQRSTDLLNWTPLTNAPAPYIENLMPDTRGFFRLQRGD